jgi:hypothetical protein
VFPTRSTPSETHPTYNVFLPAALAFAHLALAAAEILALATALNLRLALVMGLTVTFFPFTFAHLALAAAEILALPAALILRLFFGAAEAAVFWGEPKIILSFFSNDWIFSLMPAARRNCFGDRSINRELMSGN